MDFLKDLNLDKVRNLAEDAFNQAKPKTDLEAKVYEVLSHKNWGASSTVMNEIARDTYDHDKFLVITQMMWENMENQRPAAWRVVFKGLTLLEHLIKNGSERCVDDARNHGHSLRQLHQFNYYEGTIDRGLGVREKSKQLVEILSDDERIREERQKARKLRDKFGGGGGLSTASSTGGGGKYAGYGNDNWNSGGGGGSSGGYGDGGIGSSRYDNNSDSRGYSGRYDDDTNTRTQSRAAEPTPTFAAIPDDPPKKSSKMKKNKGKKKDDDFNATPAEPAIDLFSFDEPSAPAPAVSSAADDEFDSFQSAGGSGGGAFGSSDPFAAPPAAAVATHAAASFDAFGMTPQQQPNQSASFDAFGGSSQLQQQSNMAFAGGNMPVNSHDPFATPTMNGGGLMPQQQPNQNKAEEDDDDFGDFATAGGTNTSAVKVAGGPVDPLSKLISLDGLSKNPSKNSKDAKLNEPIIATPAAATFLQEKDQIHAYVQQSTANSGGRSATSFAGIDGLHKGFGGGASNMMAPPIPMSSVGFNPNVMGAGSSSNVDAISSLDPSIMMANKHHQPQQQYPGGMMMNQGFGGMGGMQQQQGGMQGGGMVGGMGMPTNMGGMPANIGGMQGGMMGGVPSGMGGMQGGMMSGMPGGMGGVQAGMMGGNQSGMGGMQSGMMSGMPGMQSNMQQGGFGMQNNMGMQQGGMGMQGMGGFMGAQSGGGPLGGQPTGGFR